MIAKGHSYKLNFQCKNNIAQYQELILALQFLETSGDKIISMHKYSKLINNQIKGEYSDKNPRLRTYRNAILDFLHCFLEYQLFLIPIRKNIL